MLNILLVVLTLWTAAAMVLAGYYFRKFDALTVKYTRHVVAHTAELKRSVRLIEEFEAENENLKQQLSDAHICIELVLMDGLTSQSDLTERKSSLKRHLTQSKLAPAGTDS